MTDKSHQTQSNPKQIVNFLLIFKRFFILQLLTELIELNQIGKPITALLPNLKIPRRDRQTLKTDQSLHKPVTKVPLELAISCFP